MSGRDGPARRESGERSSAVAAIVQPGRTSRGGGSVQLGVERVRRVAGTAVSQYPERASAAFPGTTVEPSFEGILADAVAGSHAGGRPSPTRLSEQVRAGLSRALRQRRGFESEPAVLDFFARALHGVAPDVAALIEGRLASASPASPLQHALRACTLLYLGRTPDVAPLLASQLSSGGWPSAPVYHGGRRRRRDGTFDAPHPDTPYWGSEEWTTAFCVEALAAAPSTYAYSR